MGKLHHIDSARFVMDTNGEITARFGMSIVCRVETGWGQDGDLVGFYYKGQRLTGPETRVGDIVFMDHDGPRTTWVLGRKPKDPRLELLWEFGYRASTRIRVAEPSVVVVLHELRVHAGFEYPTASDPTDWAWRPPILERESKKPVLIKDNTGNVLVALYAGYVGSGRTYCHWFMADNATITDVKSALLASSKTNKEHPLLQ